MMPVGHHLSPFGCALATNLDINCPDHAMACARLPLATLGGAQMPCREKPQPSSRKILPEVRRPRSKRTARYGVVSELEFKRKSPCGLWPEPS